MKFGSPFIHTFENKCTLFYQDTFTLGISTAYCLRGYFFPRHSVYMLTKEHSEEEADDM